MDDNPINQSFQAPAPPAGGAALLNASLDETDPGFHGSVFRGLMQAAGNDPEDLGPADRSQLATSARVLARPEAPPTPGWGRDQLRDLATKAEGLNGRDQQRQKDLQATLQHAYDYHNVTTAEGYDTPDLRRDLAQKHPWLSQQQQDALAAEYDRLKAPVAVARNLEEAISNERQRRGPGARGGRAAGGGVSGPRAALRGPGVGRWRLGLGHRRHDARRQEILGHAVVAH
jgi:hypothetical protein